MNVLIFVMTMLMLLALLTYGRLENFRSFAFIQSQFKVYMEQTERLYVNEEALLRYKSTPATKKEKSDKDENQRNPASAKLSFNLFIDKTERDQHPAEYENHRHAAKNLMTYLYGDQPFFIEMEEKRPDFLNEILNALVQATESFPEKDKIKNFKEIATIDLGDFELNDVFTRMLKGALEEPEELPKEETTPLVTVDPFKPKNGYLSLLNFITPEKNKLTVRVFLASPQLLMALYGNQGVVQSILEERYRLFRELNNGVIEKEQGNEEFKGLFLNQRLPLFPESMFDFGISKTNPRTY